jgi:hypothetical protein
MNKDEGRAAHDLMLERIERGLKEEDRSNAEHSRGKSAAERVRAMAELSALGAAVVRARGFAIRDDGRQFPGLPRS